MAPPVAAIDVGTTKICALVAEDAEARSLRVLGAGIAPSLGMKRGAVIDVNEAAQAITTAIEQAERQSRMKVEAVYVGVAGSHIQSTNARGVAAIREGRGIGAEDVHRALQAAEVIALPTNRELIHAIPRDYSLDGQAGIKNPIGMEGFRLEVEAHFVTGSAPSLQNLRKAVARAGLSLVEMVLEPIAAGEAILTDSEKEMGVALVDIGGGTTGIAIFVAGSVWHTVILPIGGLQMTNDLAVGMNAPASAAEETKLRYAHVDPSQIEHELIEVTAFGEEGRRQVERRRVAEIVRARVEEVLHLVLTEVKRSGYDSLLPAGVVLCGGTALLPGITAYAREVLQMPVRLGMPADLEGFADRISAPSFAASVGIAKWGLGRGNAGPTSVLREPLRRNGGSGLIGWAKKALLPGDSG